MKGSLEEAYREMSQDKAREADALEWIEALIKDFTDECSWTFPSQDGDQVTK